MKFDGITIISDMDGTLLTEEKKISIENINAINYFREKGGSFTIASGRMYKKIDSYSHQIHLNLPIISNNGAVIYDTVNDIILHKEFLTGKYKDVIEEIYKEHPYMGIEVYTESDVRFLKRNEYVDKHISDEKFSDNMVRWYGFHEIDEPWTKILMANSTAQSDELEKMLPKKYPQFHFVRSEAHYFEILPHNVNKGSAAKILLELINKTNDKVYAIGDNMNDYELLEMADVGVAVSNASDGLKKVADVILPYSNEEYGVAKLIEMIDKGKI